MFFQVIIIGLVNFFVSLTYIIIQRLPVSLPISLFGTLGWLMSQGMTAVVYLVVNKSIRQTIFKRLGLYSGRITQTTVYTNHPSTHLSSAQKQSSQNEKQEMEIHI
jgi:S-adenosylmethionine synthetase